MEKEKSLSDKGWNIVDEVDRHYSEEDVREAVRKLKDQCWDESGKGDWALYDAKKTIDEIFGEKLS